MRWSARGRGPVLTVWSAGLLCPLIGIWPAMGLVDLQPGGLGHRGGALRHHGNATGDGLGEGGIGGHGRYLLLPQVEIAARKRLEIGRPI